MSKIQKEYKYFISYVYSTIPYNHIHSNIEYKYGSYIESIDDIRMIEDYIKNTMIDIGYGDIVYICITDYKLF